MLELGRVQLDRWPRWHPPSPSWNLLAALVTLLLLLILLRTIVGLFRRPKLVSIVDSALVVELSSLPVPVGHLEDVRLTVYHVPVRLGVVIVAPLGRDANSPTQSEVLRLLDGIVPGLADIVRHDRPIVRVWPRQLSATGFTHSLARHVRLPGEKGRGTPWCLVAGRISADDQSFAVGMALAAAAPNKLSVIAVESENQWLDVLRVRQE